MGFYQRHIFVPPTYVDICRWFIIIDGLSGQTSMEFNRPSAVLLKQKYHSLFFFQISLFFLHSCRQHLPSLFPFTMFSHLSPSHTCRPPLPFPFMFFPQCKLTRKRTVVAHHFPLHDFSSLNIPLRTDVRCPPHFSGHNLDDQCPLFFWTESRWLQPPHFSFFSS